MDRSDQRGTGEVSRLRHAGFYSRFGNISEGPLAAIEDFSRTMAFAARLAMK